MGLLMSDTMLIDPMLDDTAWLRDSLSEDTSMVDLDNSDSDEPGVMNVTADPGFWRVLLQWPQQLIASL